MAATSLINRALKLRNMAADTSSPIEAERAAELYLRLLREHCINEADVNAAADRPPDPMEERKLAIEGLRMVAPDEREKIELRLAEWKRLLAFAVADYCCCRGSFTTGTQRFSFYGHRSDIEAAVELFRICAAQIDRACKEHLKKRQWEAEALGDYWGRGEGRSAGFAFRESAVRGLEVSLDELMSESKATEAASHALVVNRKQAVNDWVDTTYTFKSVPVGGNSGWSNEGYEAGKKLKLNDADRSLDGESRKAIAG